MRLAALLLAALILAPFASAASLRPVRPRAVEAYGGFEFPVSFAFATDGRLFVTEKSGDIKVVQGGVMTVWAHLAVLTDGEQGLLGLALDPGFAANGRVYAYATDEGNATNRVVRLADVGGVGTGLTVVLDALPRATFHNGGILTFAGDGTLFISTGDTGVPAAAQDLGRLGGKVLRVNPDGSVPADNPFSGSPVYTYGHRNVFGLAEDPETRILWETENGPTCNDEVNRLMAGGNYGWGPRETCATPPAPPANTNQDGPDPVLPLVYYTPPIAPTGASFYMGDAYSLGDRGALFFGAWNTGSLYRAVLTPDRRGVERAEAVHTVAGWGILDVETGPDGRLYFSAANRSGSGGAIFVLETVPPVGTGPENHVLVFSVAVVGVAVLCLVYMRKRIRLDRRERS